MDPGNTTADADHRPTNYHAPIGKTNSSKDLHDTRISFATWCRSFAKPYGQDEYDPKLKQKYDLLLLHRFFDPKKEYQRIVEGFHQITQINLQKSTKLYEDVFFVIFNTIFLDTSIL